MNILLQFLREEDGQDMIEYGLLASFISVVAVLSVRAIGPLVDALYVTVQNAMT